MKMIKNRNLVISRRAGETFWLDKIKRKKKKKKKIRMMMIMTKLNRKEIKKKAEESNCKEE